MRTLKLALRNLTTGNRGHLWKIIFLGVGLAAGLILLTKVRFEQSYEDFYPDTGNIYQLGMIYHDTEDEEDEQELYMKTSGGYAPLFRDNFPEVEVASRYAYLSYNSVFYAGSERQSLRGTVIMADEYLYDILPRRVIVGNAREVLSRPLYALVSENIAARLNGDPIGQVLVLDSYPGREITIGGVFEELPKNTVHEYDVIISLASVSYMWGYDGSNGLMGNDRYMSFIKVRKGTDIDRLRSSIDRLVGEIDEVKELVSQGGWEYSIFITPLREVHKKNPYVMRQSLLLLILAGAILFATVFNYLLVVLSDTVSRGRNVAVMKTFGAGFREIARNVLAETFIQMLVLTITAGALAAVFRNASEQLLGNTVADLLTWKSGLLLTGVMFFILIVSTYTQTFIYYRIPAASVFRNYRGTGRSVKLGLLFVQIAAAGFLVMMLITVNRQYHAMLNTDPGYEYGNLLTVSLAGVDNSRKETVAWELSALDGVEMVSFGSTLPIDGSGGNMAVDMATGYEIFHFADLYGADQDYLTILGVETVEGRPFRRGESVEGDIMVSRGFAQRLNQFYEWPDGVVGKEIKMTEHGRRTITGVYEDIKVGSVNSRQGYITALQYTENPTNILFIRLEQMGPEPISRITELLDSILPDKYTEVIPYRDGVQMKYKDFLMFRRSLTVASLIVLMIVFVGLIGYVKDETTRRQKEIAIRKINGATVADILGLLCGGILKMTVPALLSGMTVSVFVSQQWMREFSVKVPFSIFTALLCGVVLSGAALAAVSLSGLRIAHHNPADTIKTE